MTRSQTGKCAFQRLGGGGGGKKRLRFLRTGDAQRINGTTFGYTGDLVVTPWQGLFRTRRPLSSGTLWRLRTSFVRRNVRPWGTSRVDITSFSGRSVKLRRQVEGQHPHNATAEYHRSPPSPTTSSDPPATLFSPPFPPRRVVPSSSPHRLSLSLFSPHAGPSLAGNVRGNSNNADKLNEHWVVS